MILDVAGRSMMTLTWSPTWEKSWKKKVYSRKNTCERLYNLTGMKLHETWTILESTNMEGYSTLLYNVTGQILRERHNTSLHKADVHEVKEEDSEYLSKCNSGITKGTIQITYWILRQMNILILRLHLALTALLPTHCDQKKQPSFFYCQTYTKLTTSKQKEKSNCRFEYQ